MSIIEVDFPGNLSQVDDADDLRALPSSFIRDNALYLVSNLGLYTYNAGSIATDNDTTVLKPDDLTPLQAGRWLLSGSSLFVNIAALADPSGSSLVGFLQAGTGAVPRTAQDKMRETISVKDFGARGDGTTDDTAAILLSEAVAFILGKSLFFPGGIYRFSATLPIRVSCYGEGRGSVLKPVNGSGLDVCVTNEHPVTSFTSDIEFIGLNFNGNGGSRGAKLVGGTRVRVLRCFVEDCIVGGLAFYGVDMCEVAECHISNIVYDPGLIAADGIFFGDCLAPIAERNWITDFERIGIVVDSAGDSGSADPRVVGNLVSGASNCDLTDDEFNAGIWVENTNGGFISDNYVFDIAGNAGQTSGRVAGILVHNLGDTEESVTVCSGNTVELGDPSHPIHDAYIVGGSAQRATINFTANIARYCAIGLEIPGGVGTISVRDFTVDRMTRANSTDGAVVMSLTGSVNNILIDGLTVTNATDSVATDDWADINFTSTTGGATIGNLTVRNVHGLYMMMTPNPAGCLRLNVEGCSLSYGAVSSIYCLSAMEVTVTGTTFTYGSRGFAGLMNQNVGTGMTARWSLVGSSFIGGTQDISGSGGIKAMWSNCSFRAGAGVRLNLTENIARLIHFNGCDFDEYSATDGAIKANFSSTVAGFRLLVRNCNFLRSTDVTPIKLWNTSPGTVVLSNNVYNSTALTDMTATSATNNVVG